MKYNKKEIILNKLTIFFHPFHLGAASVCPVNAAITHKTTMKTNVNLMLIVDMCVTCKIKCKVCN